VVIPLSGREPGRDFGPSRSWVDDGGGSRYVYGKLIGYLGFSRRGVFIGEGAASEVDQGGLTHRGNIANGFQLVLQGIAKHKCIGHL
jgi:hypothetical protein